MSSQPYRTLIMGELRQQTALAVGGNRPHLESQQPLCRDGAGQLTLRGSGLAGALLATARTLFLPLPEELEQPLSRDRPLHRSPWRFYTTHPKGEVTLEVRHGVGIRQQTGAAHEGASFERELVAASTRWPLLLEIDTTTPAGEQAEAVALAALQEWRQRCWLGGAVAAGLGWCCFEPIGVYRLEQRHLTRWPHASITPEAYRDYLNAFLTPLSFEAALATRAIPLQPQRHYYHLSGTLQIGERDNGYGIDGITPGGNEHTLANFQAADLHLLAPEGAPLIETALPDHSILMSLNGQGDLTPVIPGATLRGILRHALSREARRRGETVIDPLLAKPKQQLTDSVAQCLGSMMHESALLVADSYAEPGWQSAWLQRHAEDEFSASTYGSSKFDRIVMLSGQFRWQMVCYAETPEQLVQFRSQLEPLFQQGAAQLLPLGGHQWQGMGWVKWGPVNGHYYPAGATQPAPLNIPSKESTFHVL